MAIHGVDYDRSFECLCRVPVGGDGGIISNRLIGGFTGGFLGFLCSNGTGIPGFSVFGEVLLQPFGWETHGGYRISGREGERGRGKEKSELNELGLVDGRRLNSPFVL